MTKIRAALNGDRTRAAISVPPGQVTEMDAAGVEALIWALAGCRQAMTPKRPEGDPAPGTRIASGSGMRWYVDRGPEQGSVVLMLSHPGMGWTGIVLDGEGIDALVAGLDQVRSLPR